MSPSPLAVAGQEDEDVSGPDDAEIYGRLKNSESLQNLDGLLGHPDVSKRERLKELIKRYLCLFGDMPTHTHLVEHKHEPTVSVCCLLSAELQEFLSLLHPLSLLSKLTVERNQKCLLDLTSQHTDHALHS